MTFERLWHTLRLYTIRRANARAKYLREKGIYAGIGENVEILSRKVPLYANLIKIGNNVSIASSVGFLTHDVTHTVLNRMGTGKYQEIVGCIEICDNVFIGAGTRIMYNTRIGPNAIIAAGSIVTKDVPPNSVVAGVPARVISDLDTYLTKRNSSAKSPFDSSQLSAWAIKEEVSPELTQWAWDEFYKTRTK